MSQSPYLQHEERIAPIERTLLLIAGAFAFVNFFSLQLFCHRL